MAEPKIFDRRPAVLEVEAGTYAWCACGQSTKQPFCDGSHKGGDFTPTRVTYTEKTRVAFCNCKHTSTKPACDGSHKSLP